MFSALYVITNTTDLIPLKIIKLTETSNNADIRFSARFGPAMTLRRGGVSDQTTVPCSHVTCTPLNYVRLKL